MKRILIISAIALFILEISNGQMTWTSTNLSEGTIRMGSALLGNKIYYAGGVTQSGSQWHDTDKIEIFDLSTGQWQLINLTIPRQFIAGVTCGDSIFFAGGMNNSAVPYSRIDIIYNDMLWDIAELSVPRMGISSISYDTLIFFAGGFNLVQNETYDVIDIYNAKTHQWSIDHLSHPRGSMGCTVLGNRIFFAGGCDASTYVVSDRVDIYNITSRTWDTATLSQARGFIGATSVSNKAIFAGGSLGPGLPSDRVDIYDAESDTWYTASLSIARGFWSNQSATLADTAYFVGSGIFDSGWDSDTDTMDVYDPYNDTWSVKTMPNRLNDHAVTATDNSMIVAGGFSFTVFPYGNALSEVEIYTLSTRIGEDNSTSFQSKCYPNPTNGIVNCQLSIVDCQRVSLRLYDVHGREVSVLCEGSLPPGEQTIRFDLSGLPSGIYFYRLTTEDRGLTTDTGKIVKY